VRKRAAAAWDAENKTREKDGRPLLDPIGLHECRHTFVSMMHDAGFSLEEIAPYAGHSSTYMTERYKHLIDGHEARAKERFDRYLMLADTRARIAQLDT
jgi:integrase